MTTKFKVAEPVEYCLKQVHFRIEAGQRLRNWR